MIICYSPRAPHFHGPYSILIFLKFQLCHSSIFSNDHIKISWIGLPNLTRPIKFPIWYPYSLVIHTKGKLKNLDPKWFISNLTSMARFFLDAPFLHSRGW